VVVVVNGGAPLEDVGTAEAALARFRARGGRITSSRRLLLEVLFDNPRDRTAEELAAEIHQVAPDVNMSTIYRNLDELEEAGIGVHAHLGHGPAVFNLAALAHGHLVCENCAAVIETAADIFESLARTARTAFGFDIRPHHFAVLGRCHNCARLVPTNEGESGRTARSEPVRPARTARVNPGSRPSMPGRTNRRR
jgi:Fur family ferric uptake transcriptional regulator